MNIPPQLSDDQRRSQRFQLRENTYALLRQPLYSELGQILDLSRNGISFLCLNEGGWAEGPFEIDILVESDPDQPLQEQGCIKSLPLEPISYAAEIGAYNCYQTTAMKRCGGQFRPLTPEQEAGIKLLLERHATLPLPPPPLK